MENFFVSYLFTERKVSGHEMFPDRRHTKNNIDTQTKLRVKIEKVQSSAQILKRSRLLKDIATVLEIVINKLKPDFEVMNNSQKQALVEINKTLIPFTRDTSRLLSLSAHPVSPIGGMSYVYQCKEKTKLLNQTTLQECLRNITESIYLYIVLSKHFTQIVYNMPRILV